LVSGREDLWMFNLSGR